MCLEMCRGEFSKEIFGCNAALTMISSPIDLCYISFNRKNLSSKSLREIKKKRHNCIQNCKPECLKLHYKHSLTVRDLNIDWADSTDLAEITISVKNTGVIILRHVPLYGSGEIFSHIGGLVGFWLGVSVFTFTDVIEKLCQKAIHWKKSLRMDNVQNSPTSEIHLD
ncbi:unnamed protein product [Larinioides sclopetarius]